MLQYELITDNYIWISNLGESGLYFILPLYPESIIDTSTSTFNKENIFARSAPIFSYAYSGPRSVSITLDLHREMLEDLNTSNSSLSKYKDTYVKDDTVQTIDLLINALQSTYVPNYTIAKRSLNMATVVLKIASDIYIKGIVTDLNLKHEKPIITYNNKDRYAQVSISFTITELDPYSASNIYSMGSFRHLLTNTNSLVALNTSYNTTTTSSTFNSTLLQRITGNTRMPRTQEKVEFTTGFKDISSYANSKGILLNLVTTVNNVINSIQDAVDTMSTTGTIGPDEGSVGNGGIYSGGTAYFKTIDGAQCAVSGVSFNGCESWVNSMGKKYWTSTKINGGLNNYYAGKKISDGVYSEGYTTIVLDNGSKWSGCVLPNCKAWVAGRLLYAGKNQSWSAGTTIYSGSSVKAGDIIVYNFSSGEHVAYVESVSGNNVTISESSSGHFEIMVRKATVSINSDDTISSTFSNCSFRCIQRQ